MKKFLVAGFVMMGFVASSQPFCTAPDTYYDGLEGLSCNELKGALFLRISTGAFQFSYDTTKFLFANTDRRRNDEDTKDIIWDPYTDRPATTGECEFDFLKDIDPGMGGTRECQYFNREHHFPKSWMGGNKFSAYYSDLFELYPTDKFVNGARSSFPYGEVNRGGGDVATYSNGSRKGPSAIAGIPGTVFEPIDEFKGDFARGHFYMITRYHDSLPGFKNLDANGARVLDGKYYPGFQSPFLNMLLEWHHNDPVSQKEIDRNNAIYCLQHNRNPYVDHPEYVDMVWMPGCPDVLPVDLFLFKGILVGNQVQLSWNSANEINLKNYIIERSDNNSQFIKVGEVAATQRSQYAFKDDVSNLTGRRLYYRIKEMDKDGQYKYSATFTLHVPYNTLFSIYPNPAGHQLQLHLAHTIAKAQLAIVDMQGRIVLQQSLQPSSGVQNINISSLPSGSYMVKIWEAGQVSMARLQVVK